MDILDLPARVNKQGSHVVCGMRDCSNQMARILTIEGIEGKASCIQFLSGWAQRLDGVWGFSEYARKRKSRDQPEKNRRYPEGDGYSGDKDLFDILPARAKCAKCGMVNSLTKANLGLSRILRHPAEPKRSSVAAR